MYNTIIADRVSLEHYFPPYFLRVYFLHPFGEHVARPITFGTFIMAVEKFKPIWSNLNFFVREQRYA